MTHDHSKDRISALAGHRVLVAYKSLLYLDCGSVYDIKDLIWKPIESEIAWIRVRHNTATEQVARSQAEADGLQDILDSLDSLESAPSLARREVQG
jgi:hypothetical protein